MKLRISDYASLIFDCDGVILDSNKVKSRAFYAATREYGYKNAQALVAYHQEHGGISRYEKLRYFIENILSTDFDEKIYSELLKSYAQEVRNGLLDCPVADGLWELRDRTSMSDWLLVSGGDQEELREVFASRGLSYLFNGGIFGSPESKDVILRHRVRDGLKYPALFIGDSRYDFEAATWADVEFVFLRKWTEFRNYQPWVREFGIQVFDDVASLILE